MGKDHIDASIGLAFSLSLFERYRKNGLLQAEIQHVPGIRGRCKGVLQLVEGKVVSCYIEDNRYQRHSISKETLVRVDNDKGPFEWTLMALPPPPSVTPSINISSTPQSRTATPKIIAALDLDKLDGWSTKQKLMLSIVYEAINGQRDIEEIKNEVPLPPGITEEALRVLLALKNIIII